MSRFSYFCQSKRLLTSNLARQVIVENQWKSRIAAVRGSFDRIRQVALMCIPSNPWLDGPKNRLTIGSSVFLHSPGVCPTRIFRPKYIYGFAGHIPILCPDRQIHRADSISLRRRYAARHDVIAEGRLLADGRL